MAGLPILIFLVTAILLWLIRRSHVRLLWLATVAGVVASWLTTLILTYALPFQLNILRGYPENINALLKLDIISWPFVFVLSTLLLSSLLGTFANSDDFAWKPAFQFLLAGAAGLAATMAGNTLSFVLTWAILDLTILAIGLKPASDELERARAIRHFGLGAAASILLMSAELFNRVSSGAAGLTEIRSISVFGLLFFAVLLRSSLFGDHHQPEDQEPFPRSMHSTLSTLAGFALLARILSSPLQPTILNELNFAGAVFAGISIVALWIHADLRWRQVNIGIIGLGVVLLLEIHSMQSPGQIAANVSALLILSVGASRILVAGRTWHMLTIAAIALMLIGMPGTLGRSVAESVTSIIQSENQLSFWVLAPLVLVLFGARRILEGLASIKNIGPAATKTSLQTTFAALLLPISGFAPLLVERATDLQGGMVFVVLAGAMFIFVVALRRFRINRSGNFNFEGISGFLQTMQEQFIRPIHQIMRASALLFEGESGMLWVYVILLFLYVAFGLSS